MAFSWDGVVKDDATAQVTTQLVNTAVYALKPGAPSVARKAS